MPLKKFNKLILLSFLMLCASLSVQAQTPTIPSTGGSAAVCNDCVPPGYIDNGGTPDISDRFFGAANVNPGGTLGVGAPWSFSPLPLPPNGDVRWVTLRDVGPDFPEESISTVISGLVDGQLYELRINTMTSVSGTNGSGAFYAGTYMDQFDYEIDGNPRQQLQILTRETWGISKFVFVAGQTNQGEATITFYPRRDGGYRSSGTSSALLEVVNLSVDAVNAIVRKDTDGDGIPDDVDIDDDNDGILDIEEYGLAFGQDVNDDADGDLIPNYLDTDFGGADADNNGVPDAYDFDGDGVPNHLDLDSDNDGILDNIEAQVSGAGFIAFNATDSDGDGLVDVYDNNDSDTSTSASIGLTPVNTDLAQEGTFQTPDYLDIDSDNDGIPDNVEAQTTLSYIAPPTTDIETEVGENGVFSVYENFDSYSPTSLTPVNTDTTDQPDYRDTDSDNDGLTDIEENNEGPTAGTDDNDEDGLVNNFDDDNTNYDINDDINDPDTDLPDTDGDVNTGGDVDYRDGVNGLDTDDDGIPDSVDIDDDDDGILDINECSNQTSPASGANAITLDNNVAREGEILDGIQNGGNGARFNNTADVLVLQLRAGDAVVPSGTAITITTTASNTAAKRLLFQQSDASGNNTSNNWVASYNSGTAGDQNFTGSGNGTIFTVNYILTSDATHIRISMPERAGGRINIDYLEYAGFSNCSDFDTDGDGIVDRLDVDSDNDGIPDNYEAQTTAGFIARSGIDADDDGLDDAYDANVGDLTPLASDGINPSTEMANTDSDGIPDYLDIDADDDGIPDNIEAQSTLGYMAPNGVPGVNGMDSAYDFTDAFTVSGLSLNIINTDSDAEPDFRDTDSDGDTIFDSIEGLTGPPGSTGTDADGDGLDDGYENGSINDGFIVNDGNSNPAASGFIDADNDVNGAGDLDYRDGLAGVDTDGDGIVDSVDIDDDNDGILDTVEGSGDFDGDGIINSLDMDSDGDGILDNIEAQTSAGYIAPPTTGIAAAVGSNGLFSIYENNDTASAISTVVPINTDIILADADNLPDYLDIDADNDGIPDNVEAQTTLGYTPPTGNVGANGVDSAYELNDSFITVIDLNPENTDTTLNNNADNIPDYRDIDSDGDGTLDVNEGLTTINTGTFGTDTDGDGLDDIYEGSNNNDGPDVNDEIDSPNNGTLIDADGDGNSTGDVDYRDISSDLDTDNDGVPDNIDIDDDNDGLLDINEGSGTNNPIGDEDGDGLLNFEDTADGGNGGDGSTTDYNDSNMDGIPDVFDEDGDGIPNHLDIDADNDGIPDNIEIQPTIGYIAPSGIENGITDIDGDGLDDNYDADTGNTTTAASIGVATAQNTDSGFTNSDSIPDYLDLDSDGDGTPDIQENGKPNSASGTDTDNDGLDDAFEGVSNVDGFDVNDEDNNPLTDLPDIDGDANSGADVDYRDDNDVPPTPPQSTGNILWLRADIGVTGVGQVTNWQDQANIGQTGDITFNATNPGNGPEKLGDGTALTGLNFNPVLEFQESNSEYLQITSGILGNNSSYDNIWIYAVSESNSATNDSYIVDQSIQGGDIELEVPDGAGEDFRFTNTTGTALDLAWGGSANVYNIWTAGSSSGVLTPSGNNKAIYRDGLLLGVNNTGGGTQFTSNNGDLWIGSNNGTGTYFDGSIAELLVFTSLPSSQQQQQIESYLAIKYGITLSNVGGNGNVNAGDYRLQDLTTIVWDENDNSTYHNDVAGIGRDDGMLLNQKQSRSINSDAIVTIGLGSIAANNANNSNSINSNKSFLMWGNNGAAVNNANTTSRSLLCENELQLDRVWKVVETGSIGTVQIAVPQADINAALTTASSPVRLLKIADDPTFTTNVRYIPLQSQTINTVPSFVANFDFDGTKYFTYTEVLGIFWNGDLNTWTGGSGNNGAPATDAISSGIDGLKVLVIDAETSGTNAIMTQSANVECVWVRNNSKLVIGNDLFLEFNEDFILDGEIRMVGDAQLVQSHAGLSNVQGSGKIYRDQAALVPSIYRYHYWSSPVTAALGNTTYRVMDVMKDGTTPTSENSQPKDIVFLGGGYNPNDLTNLNGVPSDPIQISSFWIYTFLNGSTRNDWIQQRETGQIPIAEGYIMKSTGRAPQNFTFVGSPNDGTYTKTLSAGTTSLLGNPYPSVLNTQQFLSDNSNAIDGTLYFWEHQGESSTTTLVEGHFEFGYIGGYSQRNQAMGVAANEPVDGTAGLGSGTYTAPPQFVAVGQSFFVSAPSNGGGTVSFENSQRDASLNNSFLRNEPEQVPNLKIGMDYVTSTNAQIHRQLGLNFKEGNTFEYDTGFDSGIFDIQPTDMFWDFEELESNLIIAGVGQLNAQLQVPLGFNIDSDQPIKIMLDEIENIGKDVNIYLVDLVTGRFYNLAQNIVELNLPKGQYSNRFILTFEGQSLSSDNPLLKDLNSFIDNASKEIVIRNNDNTQIKSVELFNITGQKVNQWKNLENQFENRLPINKLPGGIYILRINSSEGYINKKVIIE